MGGGVLGFGNQETANKINCFRFIILSLLVMQQHNVA